jgi:hypothetical protein
MKRTDLYNKTVNILVEAYFNDTLKHGNPCACAVGNLIAANKGIKIFENFMGELEWFGVSPDWWFHKNRIQAESTGYLHAEVLLIEKTFESAPMGQTEDEWMFNGLMAVIEVLDEIHENKDTEVTQKSKALFSKAN